MQICKRCVSRADSTCCHSEMAMRTGASDEDCQGDLEQAYETGTWTKERARERYWSCIHPRTTPSVACKPENVGAGAFTSHVTRHHTTC
eukprot:363712-Chlamydomonas_euryale.AAC.2